MLTVTAAWQTTYPGAAVGVLAMQGVSNPDSHPGLDGRKQALEEEIRSRFSGQDKAAIRALGPVQTYNDHYKRFKKTYHVQLQLESVAFKGKSIPRVASLIEAMFMAELKNLLLTAGHDLDSVQGPVTLDVAAGNETYAMLNGREQVLKRDDMFISDAVGVMSSVVYGPDSRTRIKPATRRALFTVYAPEGIGQEAVLGHLRDIQDNVAAFAPDAVTDLLEVYTTG
jgi:DNA/RNA-binding domain of Phe-tRNA-synthetase-like protein